MTVIGEELTVWVLNKWKGRDFDNMPGIRDQITAMLWGLA